MYFTDFIEEMDYARKLFFELARVTNDISFYDKTLPKPPKIIGKPRNALIHKKHIYFHCRSMLR